MFDCFLAQILVLLMLAACSARVFFLKKARVDGFAAFAPFALIISACIFFCFDFSPLNLFVFILSFLVFIANFRAVLRLSAKLLVDGYGAGFVILSIINLLLTFAVAALVIIFRPVRYTPDDFNVTRRQLQLSGQCANLHLNTGFVSGERVTGNLFIYEPIVHDEIVAQLYDEHPILIFSPGIRAVVQNYESYFMLLAQKGFTVLAADLYTDDLKIISEDSSGTLSKILMDSRFFRRFATIQMERIDKERFIHLIEKEKTLATKKYSALTKIALELYGDDAKVFYIVDNVDFDSIYAVIDEFNTEPYANAKGFFSMNRVDEYKTSGYGFIEQTDVLLAYGKGLERENKFFIPRYVANKTIKAIEEQK